MFESLYPIIAVLTIGVALFVFSFMYGRAFLESRMAPWVKAHPLTTRWVCLAVVIGLVFGLFFLFIKFGQPLYRALVVGASCVAVAWGFLSGLEKRFLWKEVFSLSFWFPEVVSRITAKDGT